MQLPVLLPYSRWNKQNGQHGIEGVAVFFCLGNP